MSQGFATACSELHREADALVDRVHLRELLRGYTEWFIGGSYSYDLMAWRDLDIYVLDPEHDLKRCFEIGYELTARLNARKSRFTNNTGGEPNGHYWGIKLGDDRAGAWKLDLWFLDAAGYSQHRQYSDTLRARLTEESRAAIVSIKEANWRRREYRDTITADETYRAVLDHGIRTAAEFAEFHRQQESKREVVHA